jgi:methionyl aminopeptidase
MQIILKSRREIELMRKAGQALANILDKMKNACICGITTGAVDKIAAEEMRASGAISQTKNYPTYKPNEGFPGHTCISINEEVIHGIPDLANSKTEIS